MLMSDLTHRSIACKAHLNMLIENALYKFITITITISTVYYGGGTECLASFHRVELLNLAPRIKTKVYVKPTNTGLLLHYQSHVDNRYKRSLITTMLDRAHRISSVWSYFSQECDRLETVFLKLKYPRHLFNLGCQAIR